MQPYEKLGLFYLGKELREDPETGERPLLLYPSSNLSTHALCVGMTGSGKTGLCIGLLEEAAIDGIPSLIIDPKGDMANLCLGFPNLIPEDFLPWISETEAKSENLTREAYAEKVAANWRKGLNAWDQSGERINFLRENADITVYTPASTAGEPLSLLESFSSPGEEVLQDFNTLSNLVAGTSAGLLGLLGIEADPLKSREMILLSNIFQQVWHQGRDVDLPTLISLIQEPPFSSVGVLDIESFYPRADRDKLALRFNNLIASPTFAQWMKGYPMDIDSLLYNEEGKAKVSIISISHLTEEERMFFVSLFLNRLLAWTRSQTGSQSLRAIFYMDEIYGYFPPVANPPSKRPLLTLLKQARAYGVGVVLTTQNPIDLDYKGLSNIGTWWIGRLQTENDRARLLDGMQDAASTTGESFSRQEMDQLIAGLEKRQFLMNNVHSNQVSLFESRFCLSYLKGPMSLQDIRQLKELNLYNAPSVSYEEINPSAPAVQQDAFGVGEKIPPVAADSDETAAGDDLLGVELGTTIEPAAPSGVQPASVKLPKGVTSYFLPTTGPVSSYRPLLAGFTEVYYLDKKTHESTTVRELRVVEPEDGPFPINWDDSTVLDIRLEDLETSGDPNVPLIPLPAAFLDANNYKEWEKSLVDFTYRESGITKYENKAYGIRSSEGEDERDFRIRLAQETREQREEELEKLRGKYEKLLATQEDRVRRAEQQADKREDMKQDAKRQTVISVGTSILNAILGKKKLSTGAIGHAATATRNASRANRLGADVSRAEENLEKAQEKYEDLVAKMEEEVEALSDKLERTATDVETVELKALKRDCKVRLLAVLWQGQI